MSKQLQFPAMVAEALEGKDLKAAASFLNITAKRLTQISKGEAKATLEEVDKLAAVLGLDQAEARRAAWADVAKPVDAPKVEAPKKQPGGSYGPSASF